MRGTHRCRSGQRHCKGIIPAYAGNTSASRNTHARGEDHPRVCGEHGRSQPDMKSSLGSSPRMRGTRQTYAARWCQRGIIPAYAGNTVCLPSYSPCLRDHPRVCGEHDVGRTFALQFGGSSPRMRGTRELRREGGKIITGIIPAYAGNTLDALSVASMVAGSSPRMRGTQVE